MKALLVFILVAVSGSSLATVDHRRALIEANPPLAELSCAYRVASENAEGVQRVERFDGEWQLETIDGETPNEDALEKYADQAEAREERNAPTSMDLEKLIIPGTLALADETDQGLQFDFQVAPEEEKDADFLKHMDASLFTAADYRVTRFHMKNRKPVSPQTGVKLNDFEQTMHFEWNEGLQGVVLARMEMKIDGRAFLVKKIEQDLTLWFSDIECQSDL